MQEGTVKAYQSLQNHGIPLNGSKLSLLLACLFSKDKSWGNLGETLPCFCFVQSRIFNSWDV